jgi:PAS domain S-box-containing protein
MQNEDFIKACQHPDFLLKQSQLLVTSYHHWSGLNLIDDSDADHVKALQNAPYAVASHNADVDPLFNYANQQALQLFGMQAEDMLGLPSRYSAEAMLREARAEFLHQVSTHGYIDDYSGVRIAKDGSRFLIEQATVWNVIDIKTKEYFGQAVIIKAWNAL